jgi:hypothetical protein
MNRFIALLKLAWERCNIGAYIGWITGVLFFAALFLWSFLEFYAPLYKSGEYSAPFTQAMADSLAGTSFMGILLCIWPAFVSAVCLFLFIIILFSLADYTVAFLQICYIYDNKSWELVNAPGRFCKWCVRKLVQGAKAYMAWDRARWKDYDDQQDKFYAEFEAEVIRIRDSVPEKIPEKINPPEQP